MKKKRSMKYGVLLTASLGLLLIFTAFFATDSQASAYERTIEHFNEILSTADFDNAAEAAIALRARIAEAEALLADTYVSVDGTDVPRGSWWARQEAHDVFSEAIETAKTALRLGGTFNFDVTIGTEYAIPFAVERAPLPASFTIAFNPEKLVFAGMTEGADVVILTPHNPEEGVVAFAYLGDSPELSRTGVIGVPHFFAFESGATAIAIVGDFNELDETKIVADGEMEMPIPSVNTEIVYLDPFVIEAPNMNIVLDSGRESRSEFPSISFPEAEPITNLEEFLRSLPEEERTPPIFDIPIIIGESGANIETNRAREFRTDFLPIIE